MQKMHLLVCDTNRRFGRKNSKGEFFMTFLIVKRCDT